MNKFSDLPLQDNIYIWIANFLTNRDHRTKFDGSVSARAGINANIVQGTTTGPGSFDVNASDLHPRHPENHLNKYADDCYLIVRLSTPTLFRRKSDHVAEWADANNLKLNSTKVKK